MDIFYIMDNQQQVLFHKMKFIMNALEDGWSVKKNKESYIFKKKHERKREVFEEKYLEKFVKKHMEK